MRSRRGLVFSLVAGLLLVVACGDAGPTLPRPENLSIAVQGGDQQLGAISSPLPLPLQAMVTEGPRSAPVRGVTVTWTVVSGDVASITPLAAVTDSAGNAAARLTLGPSPGPFAVSATFPGNTSSPAIFRGEAVLAASVADVTPASAAGGDTITLTGSNFSAVAANDQVFFDGARGVVVSASATRLRVVVPYCLSARTVQVVVRIGPLSSPPAALEVTASDVPPLDLRIGQVATLADPIALGCLQLPAAASPASYLLVIEDATDVADRSFSFQLGGALETAAASAQAAEPVAPAPFLPAPGEAQAAWDARLRAWEREIVRTAPTGPRAQAAPRVAQQAPRLGDERTFSVVNKDNEFTKVTAVVRAITAHAVIYEDRNAPAGGLTMQDYQSFAATFDDPIYNTDVSVYGAPSDIDGNGKVDILFTPVVNQETPAGSSSFIAGFFYGCDLVAPRDCSGSNQSEIFYSLVPDPTGKYGMAQSKSQVLQTVPPVLAHEFMHMIHFNQRVLLRGAAEEALWLSEALAHAAEDTVGGVFLSRGDSATAVKFKQGDWVRAYRYLRDPPATGLLAFQSPGTLEERGAGWLFVKYLEGRFGGGILTRLTQTTRSGTDNVATQAGTDWSALVNDWAVALYADDLGLAGLDPRFTFPNFDSRRWLSQPALGGRYPLQPPRFGFSSFTYGDVVRAGSAAYVRLDAPAGGAPLTVRFTDTPLDGDGALPRIAVLRLR